MASLNHFKKLNVPVIIETLENNDGDLVSLQTSINSTHNISSETYVKSPVAHLGEIHTDDEELDHR